MIKYTTNFNFIRNCQTLFQKCTTVWWYFGVILLQRLLYILIRTWCCLYLYCINLIYIFHIHLILVIIMSCGILLWFKFVFLQWLMILSCAHLLSVSPLGSRFVYSCGEYRTGWLSAWIIESVLFITWIIFKVTEWAWQCLRTELRSNHK